MPYGQRHLPARAFAIVHAMLVLIPLGAAARGETDLPWNPLASSLPMDVVVSEVRTQPRRTPIELRYTLRFEPAGSRLRISHRGLASVHLQGRALEPAGAWSVAKLLLPVMEIDDQTGEPSFPDNDRGWRDHYLDVVASANGAPEIKAMQRAVVEAIRQQSGAPVQMLYTSLGIMQVDEQRRELGVDWDTLTPRLERVVGKALGVRQLPDGPPPESLERIEIVAVIPANELRAGSADLLEKIEESTENGSEKVDPIELGDGRMALVLGIAPESGRLREMSLEINLGTDGDPALENARLTSHMRFDWQGASRAAEPREGFRLGACDARQVELPIVWGDDPLDASGRSAAMLMCGSGVATSLDDGATLQLRRIAGGEESFELRVRRGNREWRGTNESDSRSIDLADEAGRIVAQASVSASTLRGVYAEVVNRPAGEVARQLAQIADASIAGEELLCDERITLMFDGIPDVSLAALLADVCGMQFVSVETPDGIRGAFKAGGEAASTSR